ncbi:MAG: DUF3810 domain-containing protein [Eubacteriales bacterium]|nr:DUF3810 domain-containing protein [Eubacteriales bacterium]
MRNKTDISIKLFSAGLLLLLAAAALLFAAVHSEAFSAFYARHIYSFLIGSFGRLSGLFPFSLSEIIIYCTPLAVIGSIIRFRHDPAGFSAWIFFIISLLAFLFVSCCGINYHSESFTENIGLEAAEEYSAEDIAGLLSYLTDKVNENAGAFSDFPSPQAEREKGREAMRKLGESYAALSGYYPYPKPMLISYFMSVQQLCGIYSPFTLEAVYNRDMPDYNIPHSMCHELSHLKGFMREEEANFIGFLACIGSDDASFRYSGYLTAWVYAGNALSGEDPEGYAGLRRSLCQRADKDLEYNNAFWHSFDGPVSEAQTEINDAYLKANGQAKGVKSYDYFVELMLAYFQQSL